MCRRPLELVLVQARPGLLHILPPHRPDRTQSLPLDLHHNGMGRSWVSLIYCQTLGTPPKLRPPRGRGRLMLLATRRRQTLTLATSEGLYRHLVGKERGREVWPVIYWTTSM